jgi:hypothetical protein
MSATVIFTHGGGRFGNQLVQFGHLIALTEDHRDLRLINASFWPYADLCAGTQDNPLCFYAPDGRPPPALGTALARSVEGVLSILPSRVQTSLRFRLPRMAHRHLPSRSVDLEDTWGGVEVTAFGGLRVRNPPGPNLHSAETFNLANPALIARLSRPGSVLLAGWPFRDWDAFDRHAGKVRAFLAPAGRFQDIATPFILALRRQYRTLVGVLIRQQDYRVWDSGRYFFPSAQYREWMMQAAKVFGPDCCLVVATDEHQAPDLLQGLNAVWCTGAMGQDGHFVESIAELSRCDVIVSPPSTFAGWAAFLRQVPLLPLTRPDQIIRREDLTGDPFHTVERRPTRAPS